MKARILLVDDVRANLLALEGVLDSPELELVSVSSGAAAIREVEAGDFAVILLDVQMPKMDGFETATRIKTITRAQHVPIIFVTAIDHEAQRVTQSYKHGGVDFIQKPFEIEVMRAKVAVFVELWKSKAIALREAEHARQQVIRAEAERLTTSRAEATTLQQEFLSTLSNELRPPINAILGWTRMLKDGSLREAQRVRALENVERNALGQLELIEQMLDISLISGGRLEIESAPVDLGEIVELAFAAVHPAAADKQVELQRRFDRDIATVHGDAARLQQIVQQLLANSVKFTPEGGVITVSLSNVGSSVEIVIVDPGVGIEATLLPTLFDGVESRAGSPRAKGGIGVGFAIIRHLVTLHGGTIEAQSAGPAPGCQFTVKLPARS